MRIDGPDVAAEGEKAERGLKVSVKECNAGVLAGGFGRRLAARSNSVLAARRGENSQPRTAALHGWPTVSYVGDRFPLNSRGWTILDPALFFASAGSILLDFR